MSASIVRTLIAVGVLASMIATTSPAHAEGQAHAEGPAHAEGAESTGERREHRAVARALRLLSLEPGVRVRLIDPELAGNPRELRRLDAFVVREPDGALRPVVYLNRESEIVRRAAAGSELHVHVLAAVIHHEARHLAGASEAEARRAELAFFQALVARGSVPPSVGHQYLQLLSAAVSASPGR